MGRVDLNHSRRTNYAECIYWIRDENDAIANASKWVLENQPAGDFYAKSVSPKTMQELPLQGTWMFDKNSITLETDDDISDITRGSIVKYNNKLWFVVDVQGEVHEKESAFSEEIDYKYFLLLRR